MEFQNPDNYAIEVREIWAVCRSFLRQIAHGSIPAKFDTWTCVRDLSPTRFQKAYSSILTIILSHWRAVWKIWHQPGSKSLTPLSLSNLSHRCAGLVPNRSRTISPQICRIGAKSLMPLSSSNYHIEVPCEGFRTNLIPNHLLAIPLQICHIDVPGWFQIAMPISSKFVTWTYRVQIAPRAICRPQFQPLPKTPSSRVPLTTNPYIFSSQIFQRIISSPLI